MKPLACLLKNWFFITLVFLFFLPSSAVFAQDSGVLPGETLSTNPKVRTTTVTASVRDNEKPSVPVLIAPGDNTYVTTSRPTYIWRESTDDYKIDKYNLYIDGVLFFEDIKPETHTTLLYSCVKRGEELWLTPTASDLSQGSHTWKVIAYDNNGNNTASATWTFTIDTNVPILVVTQVGTVIVSISSQDVSTIPTEPIVLYTNQPTISGTTEANASVLVTVTFPDGRTITQSTTATGGGTFSVSFPVLPRDTVLYIQVSSKDLAGNSSIIDGIPFIIQTKKIIPPPPIRQIIPEITPPVYEEVREEIIITITEPIKEIVEALPEPISTVVTETVSPAIKKLHPLWSLINFLIGLIIPVTRFSFAVYLSGIPMWFLSFPTIKRVLQAIGLFPKRSILLPPFQESLYGIVFDADTFHPLPHAVVTLFQVRDGKREIIDEMIADNKGMYTCIRTTRNRNDEQTQFFINAYHRHAVFQTALLQKRFFGIDDVYYGQTITNATCETKNAHREASTMYGLHCTPSEFLLTYLVPMITEKNLAGDARAEARAQDISYESFAQNIHTLEKKYWYTQLPTLALFGVTAIMAFLAFMMPSIWNIGMAVFYAVAVGKRMITR